MFTGVVQTTANIVENRTTACGRRLRLEVGVLAGQCTLGESISVSGVCLTVAARTDSHLEFDVIPETLCRTTLGRRQQGDRVNLERSLRIGDRLDGHFVQGHVDAIGNVVQVARLGNEYVIRIAASESVQPYIIPKGSICIDGVSLTLAEVAASSFSVALIPTTLKLTTLGDLRVGDSVNLETDIIARTVVENLRRLGSTSELTIEKLQAAGFA
ncbi:MAG: riboflavin synthase [Planctomycetes bacterium]|nr:riboflavin synthase [Planctomycetota bacterium]MBI3833616.1 riboflavin synthase [Planctomycetota bacterium]